MAEKKTAFFNDERCYWHIGGNYIEMIPVGGWVQPAAGNGLAESPETKRRFRNLVDATGLLKQLDDRSAPSASMEDVLRIHPQSYVDTLKSLSDAGGGDFGDSAPIGPGSYEIALQSAGLACAAVEAVLDGEVENAYSLSRPPGHHCLPDRAIGFCVLANIAIAIERAKVTKGLGKVAVIDWDVHHGNGTQDIFYNRSDVLTISLHQDRCFPAGYSGEDDIGEGEGEGYNMNIPLQPGGGDEAYRYAFEQLVLPALDKFEPDLIIVASGYDANAVDPLARMQLHSETYRWMTQKVMDSAQRLCDGKVVIVHEGGYSEAYVPFCGLAIMETLSGIKTAAEDPLLGFIQAQQPAERWMKAQRQAIDQQKEKVGL
ncbi:MAG: class II histone deacetylase [Oleibacter sp.]|nr:class II histone deacetylase [Thalassolituus sp.]|tara:strand:- start:1684 stop:2799 length:1116 start_codon:yes stop_codon:yes gene_type:complete